MCLISCHICMLFFLEKQNTFVIQESSAALLQGQFIMSLQKMSIQREKHYQLVNTFGSVPHIDSLFVFKRLIFML